MYLNPSITIYDTTSIDAIIIIVSLSSFLVDKYMYPAIFVNTSIVQINIVKDLFVNSISVFHDKFGLNKSIIPASSILLLIVSIAVISPTSG